MTSTHSKLAPSTVQIASAVWSSAHFLSFSKEWSAVMTAESQSVSVAWVGTVFQMVRQTLSTRTPFWNSTYIHQYPLFYVGLCKYIFLFHSFPFPVFIHFSYLTLTYSFAGPSLLYPSPLHTILYVKTFLKSVPRRVWLQEYCRGKYRSVNVKGFLNVFSKYVLYMRHLWVYHQTKKHRRA
jgi:hypothetical protein